MTKHGIMPAMAKDELITMRTSRPVKLAIERAAKEHGRNVSNYLLWLAIKDDAGVKAAYEGTVDALPTDLQRGLKKAADQVD